jgi:uncharacterized protein (TIGR02246 family)
MRRTHTIAVGLLLFTLGSVVSPASADDDSSEQVRAALRDYVEAFNAHDAAAVAAHWAENAVYTDRETGEKIEGREALEADFAALFEANPESQLVGEITDISFVTDDVAIVNGTASVYAPDADPSLATFSATFVRQDNAWLLHSVNESDIPVPESAYDALQPLAWMVGTWVDEAGDVRVETTVSWAPGGSFLIRAFSIESGEETVKEGTQVIGWDPRAREIRSWSFDSDGSFGDGVWTLSGGKWLVQSTQTLADGAAASGTYVITPVDADSFTVQLIGHEVEGEPLPTSEVVTIVRSSAEQAAAGEREENGGNE